MLTTLYINSSCTSSRKAVNWFKERNIPIREVNIGKTPLSREELTEILKMSEGGLDELLRRTVNREAINDMCLSEAVDHVIKNPRMVKTPIAYNGEHYHVGFSRENFESFFSEEHYLLRQII